MLVFGKVGVIPLDVYGIIAFAEMNLQAELQGTYAVEDGREGEELADGGKNGLVYDSSGR